MSKMTNIHWADSTANPIVGCNGCELWNAERETCYAWHLHKRWPRNPGFSPNFATPKLFPGRMADAAAWRNLSGTARTNKPWLDGLPRLIFISDMGDALSEANVIDHANKPVPDGAVAFDFLKREIIDAVLSANGSRHYWPWLTKRPRRMAAFSRWLRETHRTAWPRHLWAGTTVTTAATLGRIDDLRAVGDEHTIRLLSLEPLWEGVSLAGHLEGISWVILGGESTQGSQAKEFKLEWARQLRDECRAAGVAFFMKQLGATPTLNGQPFDNGGDRHGGNWENWPADLRIREMPIHPETTPVVHATAPVAAA